MMTTKHIELLTLIAQGNYLPQLHAPHTMLAYLYRYGLIRYGGWNVEITDAGRSLLATFAQKEPAT